MVTAPINSKGPAAVLTTPNGGAEWNRSTNCEEGTGSGDQRTAGLHVHVFGRSERCPGRLRQGRERRQEVTASQDVQVLTLLKGLTAAVARIEERLDAIQPGVDFTRVLAEAAFGDLPTVSAAATSGASRSLQVLQGGGA
jgi:hypothetical protein